MTITKSTKIKQIKREWHLIDAQDKILGRLATEIAQLLIGKKKPYFVYHLDCGDFIVVINAKKVKVTGKKEAQKIYTRYSGYPGGLKKEPLSKLREKKPEEIIRRAVSGMLPKNKLRKKRLKRLYVFADDQHPYAKNLEPRT
ncbi:50S ribosomal protein L13 [Candidatus Microgenomates bacterium]|nr:50S ribosomal protein L13 [Candidatus Microgenomates bacterium]